MQLTASPNLRLLRAIDQRARDSLVEMARWQVSFHAHSSRLLLGRIAGIDQNRLLKMVDYNGQVETIVSALPRRR